MPDDQYNRYYEERMRMMRWLQNFGLRQARTTDQKVAMPGSMSINHAARQQARHKDDSDNAAAYIRAANAKMNRGDYDGAIADCDRAIALDPDDPGGCNIRGMSKWRKGDHDDAIADFDRAIELDPEHGMAYHIRGMIKGDQGNYEEAIADFDRAIELDITDADIYNWRGFAKMSIGDYSGAVADYDRAIALDPNDAYAQENRSIALERLEDQ